MIVKGGSSFLPAPDGVHDAVCVDVVDMGMVDGPYGPKHQLRIVWEIDAAMEDGRRFLAQKRYGASLHEKATLHKDLKSWRGRPFTTEELDGFDVEAVIGANCLINVQHKASTKDPKRTYANVVSVMPLIKGMTKMAALGYERPSETAPEPEPEPEAEPDHTAPLDEDTIPF